MKTQPASDRAERIADEQYLRELEHKRRKAKEAQMRELERQLRAQRIIE